MVDLRLARPALLKTVTLDSSESATEFVEASN